MGKGQVEKFYIWGNYRLESGEGRLSLPSTEVRGSLPQKFFLKYDVQICICICLHVSSVCVCEHALRTHSRPLYAV